jgi:spore germination protein KB
VQKEQISMKQGLCILLMFIFGSSVVMGVNTQVEQDSWMSLLLAAAGSIPMVLVYARLIRLNPGMGLFDMMEMLLGKVGGKVAVALMAWYALHVGSMVMRNFSEFIEIIAMPETPQLPIIIGMMLVTAYMAKCGVETLGRWALGTFVLIPVVVTLTVLLSLTCMDLTNLQPVMSHTPGEIAKSSLMLFAFPFAETVMLLAVANGIKKADSPYKLYLGALLLGTLMLLVVLIRNIALLGAPIMRAEYFPSYAMARVIRLGNFLSRIEISISVNFVLGGIVKISLCFLAAAKGVARLFALPDYRRVVMPVGLLMVALCAIVFDNTMEMFAFLPIYQFYTLPFQVVIPLIVWIAAEVDARKKKRQAAAPAPAQQ